MNRAKSLSLLLLLLSCLAVPTAWADSVEGRLTGLKCATKGKLCPSDKDDPHIMLERDFVVMREDGRYYFVTNMDWHTKLGFVLEMVRVEGRMSENQSVIAADEFWVKREGEYRLEWSLERARKKARAQREREQQLWLNPPNDN